MHLTLQILKHSLARLVRVPPAAALLAAVVPGFTLGVPLWLGKLVPPPEHTERVPSWLSDTVTYTDLAIDNPYLPAAVVFVCAYAMVLAARRMYAVGRRQGVRNGSLMRLVAHAVLYPLGFALATVAFVVLLWNGLQDPVKLEGWTLLLLPALALIMGFPIAAMKAARFRTRLLRVLTVGLLYTLGVAVVVCGLVVVLSRITTPAATTVLWAWVILGGLAAFVGLPVAAVERPRPWTLLPRTVVILFKERVRVFLIGLPAVLAPVIVGRLLWDLAFLRCVEREYSEQLPLLYDVATAATPSPPWALGLATALFVVATTLTILLFLCMSLSWYEQARVGSLHARK